MMCHIVHTLRDRADSRTPDNNTGAGAIGFSLFFVIGKSGSDLAQELHVEWGEFPGSPPWGNQRARCHLARRDVLYQYPPQEEMS